MQQGDVVGMVDVTGTPVVHYTYDAWGNLLSTTGSLASTIGALNPIRYRGYVYDPETGLYYLQSRYYDPEIGRFINADAYASTGQGFTGNNMFAYCGNNPVTYEDDSGGMRKPCTVAINDDGIFGQKHFGTTNSADAVAYGNRSKNAIIEEAVNTITNDDEEKVIKATSVAFYKGTLFIKAPFMKDSAFSFGAVFMGTEVESDNLVRHEYGHVVHLDQIGALDYIIKVALPSVISIWSNPENPDYFSQPWEYIADVLGGVDKSRRDYLPNADRAGTLYYLFTLY